MAIALPFSVVIGLTAARNDRNWIGATTTVASVIMTAIPEFVVGVVLLIIFGVTLAVFPTSADVSAGGGWGTGCGLWFCPPLPSRYLFAGISRE
ncbi:hypothetical protein LP421_34130 (plasmid) [Rhizobium sp. RCAM05350]|uniref:hypothetical protein n=1 Tax=Rhizobium sp. RCAM05350 TaxID=2895568 RepID=UPI0020766FA3|nr:hypothetical protein [Rhizobium sp. RCAM05350]URK89434.1 hypothetical protein LP421_34130 [Rhizobium sp. RCAM05350]